MNESLQFRPATENDLEKLSDLVNSAYRGDSSRAGWTTEADLLDGQRTDPQCLAKMLGGEQIILLAEDSRSTLLGCVYLKQCCEAVSYLGMLTVLPTIQDRGLGRQILESGEKYVVDRWRSQKLKMTVITLRRELLNWYERRGYRATDKIESFPYGDPRFGLPKRSDLQFVVLEKALEKSNFLTESQVRT